MIGLVTQTAMYPRIQIVWSHMPFHTDGYHPHTNTYSLATQACHIDTYCLSWSDSQIVWPHRQLSRTACLPLEDA